MSAIKNSYRRAKSRYSAALAILLAAFVLIAGCSSGPKNEQANNNANANVTAEQKNSIPFLRKDRGEKPTGTFKPLYAPVSSEQYAQMREGMRQSKILEQIVGNLNQVLIIPVDVTVALTECGVPNAFYNPKEKQISLCYELLDHFYKVFQPHSETQEELDEAVMGAAAFVFIHELGHCLIDVLDLPVTGKEEDAVDQLATLVLADGTDQGEKSVLNGARSFMLEENQGGDNLERLPFWDEHSLSQQRFYNLVCWLYGHDETKYEYLVEQGVLPEQRAVRCKGEFQQLARSWNRLMKPHMRQ